MRKERWTPEQKVSIVLEGIKGDLKISELCRQNGMSQTQFYRWRDEFLKAGKEALSNKSNRNGKKRFGAKIKELEQIIGRLTIENQILKKTEELMGM